ncbi:MAG: peptidylprolyl isomerase [Sphingobacteriales bacterium]|nr:MAG: peptidylprolyl isomerase [Sphingobacteriales bacterium]
MFKNLFFLFLLTVNFITLTAQNETKVKEPRVLITTDFGNIIVKLYNETPYHRDNFLKLVKEGFYNDLLFHRIIKDFMIQGGDPNSRNAEPGQQLGMGSPGYTLPAEINPNLFHKKGALSAARTGDQGNPQRRSSGSQFYLVHGKVLSDADIEQLTRNGFVLTPQQIETYKTIGGTAFLDAQYTVFGEIVEGLEVLEKIIVVPTQAGDRPVKDVKMTMTVLSE